MLHADPYEADDVRNACMQPIDDSFGDFVGTDMWNAKNPISEDCLYLNVWTPDVSKVDDEQAAPPTALKAVMVYESIICQPHSIESIYLHSDYSTSSALQCLSPDLPLTLSILTLTPNVNLRGRIRDNWEQMTGPV